MSHYLQETLALTGRGLRQLTREPISIAFNLIQPILWLVLFGNLFQRTVRMPSFPHTDYLTFMAAGVIVMTVLGNGMTGGIPLLFDKETGFLLKLLAAPISRSAIIVSRFLCIVTMTLLQVLVMLGMAVLLGVRVASGLPGLLLLLLIAVLLTAGLTAVSLGLAFLFKSHGEFFAITGFLTLPAIFLSSALAPLELMPFWMQIIARLNPMTYAIDAARALIVGGWQADRLMLSILALLVFNVLCFAWAIRVFKRQMD